MKEEKSIYMDIMTILSVSSAIVTIVTPIITVIIKRMSKQKPLPCYTKLSQSSINSDKLIEDLCILYKGEEVNNITVTTLTFWNDGHEEINNTIYPDDKLPSIVPLNDDIKILNCEILEVYDNDFVDLSEPLETNNWTFGFKRLGYQQGVTFRIVHTGKHNKDINLKIKLNNNLKLKKVYIYPKSKTDTITKIGVLFIILLLSYVLASVCLYNIIHNNAVNAVYMGFSSIGIIFLLRYQAKLYFSPLKKLPKRFRKYYSHIDE